MKQIALALREIRKATADCNYSVQYFDIVLGADKIVGSCSACIGTDKDLYLTGHVGYKIDPEHRGKGYAVQAVELLKPIFQTNGIDKIYITHNPKNEASKRVCEKLKAKCLGTVELPPDHNKRITCGETHKTIWELGTRT